VRFFLLFFLVNVLSYEIVFKTETKNVRKGGMISLRTFSLLKGLPVYELKSGEKIGDVYDLNISSNGIVKGLLIKKGDFFRKTFTVRIENVASFGWDGVMVEDKKVLEPIKSPPEYTFEHKHSLSGKMMMSDEGEKLGLLEDVYFMEEVGTIVGYELTDGFFSDITEGKRVVKTVEPPAIGKDAIIVNVKST
jgi:uncharacterized protein YrrD